MSGGPWTLLCDDPALAVELARAAEGVDVTVAPRVTRDLVGQARQARQDGAPVALALLDPPAAEVLCALPSPTPLALLRGSRALRHLATDLGHPVVGDVAALVAVLALDGIERPWEVGLKHLEPPDRARLEASVEPRRDPVLEAGHEGMLLHHGRRVGDALALAEALEALRALPTDERPRMPRVEGVPPQQVLDVIVGPPRVLSDPASKAALSVYDVPLPVEELCSSPSRCAAEASRIGFPVRVALASPDLRVWENPDLSAERVDSATRAKEAFRQIMSLAEARAPEARLIGVTVSAMRAVHAILDVCLTPLPNGLVLTRLGFADAHGRASEDTTDFVLPCTAARLDAAVRRLRGHSLLTEPRGEWREFARALGDALLRIAAFVHDWRREVAEVQLRPIALLVGGEVEIREASVRVTDAFERSLDESA